MPKATNTVPSATPHFPDLEKEILEFWDSDKTFQKSVEQRSADHAYVFYDGPPFATGLPHYGHILASTIKDVIPRYQTMKGFRVERVWGWDCHGLPIENMIEKELELKGGKKGIEAYGIDKFNAACRSAILRFDKDWEVVIRRIGRWVDFKHSYKTMDKNYMESVWWGFSELNKKGLVYEGRRVVLYCPRCATPLSNFEIAMDNSYKDVDDNSVYVKFKVVDRPQALLANKVEREADKNEYLLAWTTTPWTLPGNVGLAVRSEAEYSKIEIENELYWVAKDKVGAMAKLKNIAHPEILETVKGEALVGVTYEPLYTDMPLEGKKAYYVLAADFVSLEDGTGIVHTAAIYGEDDYALAKRHDLPCVPTLDDEGKFFPFVKLVAGLFYKKGEAPIMEDLQSRGLLFRQEKYRHSYPFCYRCGTPLYYSAVPAWFIDVQKIKPQLIAANADISWYPEHLKEGRFGKGLATAPDWNVSRSRYWGTPMPIWAGKNKDGQQVLRIVSSQAELQKWAVLPDKVAALDNLHREFIDDLEVWVDDAKTVKGKRIPEVFDCWVESASMPFAALHYPFANKQQFEVHYPAQFISEYIAQTRAWFYCMHVMSVGIFGKPSFQHALTTGTILAEDGSKMSKSKKNYPDPTLLIEKYGVDSLRLYLMSSVVMKADNLNFSEKEVDELRKKVFVIWWNVLSFYEQFADHKHDARQCPADVTHVLDKWMLSRLQSVVAAVTQAMDGYDVVRASRILIDFMSELSNWYLRQSRERIKSADNVQVSHVLGYALYTLAQLFAPITPFFSEVVHQHLVDAESSIHLGEWPAVKTDLIDEELEKEMTLARWVTEQALAVRREHNLKVRQPLAKAMVTSVGREPRAEVLAVVAQEINVKKIEWKKVAEKSTLMSVSLDEKLTPELIEEGQAREAMRQIQDLRKKAGVQIDEQVRVQLPSWPAEWEEQIKAKTKVSELGRGSEVKLIS